MADEKSSNGFDSLRDLALDLRWSWNHGTDNIWRELDPNLWKLTRHPYTVLQAVPREEVERRRTDWRVGTIITLTLADLVHFWATGRVSPRTGLRLAVCSLLVHPRAEPGLDKVALHTAPDDLWTPAGQKRKKGNRIANMNHKIGCCEQSA